MWSACGEVLGTVSMWGGPRHSVCGAPRHSQHVGRSYTWSAPTEVLDVVRIWGGPRRGLHLGRS